MCYLWSYLIVKENVKEKDKVWQKYRSKFLTSMEFWSLQDDSNAVQVCVRIALISLVEMGGLREFFGFRKHF